MRTFVEEINAPPSPDALARILQTEPGLVFLRSALFESQQARYSFVAADPFLTFRSWGSRCEIRSAATSVEQFGNPWRLLEDLLSRYEVHNDRDLPFPTGGCFGFWGYDLKNFVEPKLGARKHNDLGLPDAHLGFYDSLVVFDHVLEKCWIVSSGLRTEGNPSTTRARVRAARWRAWLEQASVHREQGSVPTPLATSDTFPGHLLSNLTRAGFVELVKRAKCYIRSGDIYQVNLSQRFEIPLLHSSWALFECLLASSPAPFSAFLDCGDFQLVSSSPELFLRLSGQEIQTRPIKGTRPRSKDPLKDAQLRYELQTSTKELAELVMITDLLRNDLGRICQYGSVHVPEIARLEQYAQVQHLVSTVEGRLSPGFSHCSALASCFPGGSITGAPKFRAMQIIDELEPVARGPYTGALGYIGFNGESQLSIIIRTAVCSGTRAWFHSGAGIVADSDPEAEYEETLVKAQGFSEALARAAFCRQKLLNPFRYRAVDASSFPL